MNRTRAKRPPGFGDAQLTQLRAAQMRPFSILPGGLPPGQGRRIVQVEAALGGR